MKKLIALLLVVCMVAGLFIGCKKKTKDPVTDPTASGATEATEAVDATEGTEDPTATGETEAPEATEGPEDTEGEQSAGKKPTAATRPKKTTSTKATKATKATGATKATQEAVTKATSGATKATTAVNSKYKGKTLEIYGLGTDDSEYYTNMQTIIDNESTKIYPHVERAAIVEWAAMNGVNIVFKGDYNQNTVMAAINAGEKPDVVFQSNQFESLALNGLAASLTSSEYKKLAEVVGEGFLDLCKFGSKNLGFVRPWTGTHMLYYNVDMFTEYGVKTPKEHFLEGTWTWDTFLETMVAMTKDTNGDSKIDTYGLNGDSWGFAFDFWKTNAKGELVSVIDEPYVKDFIALKYNAWSVKKCTIAGQNKIQTNVINPMFAMQISDCEPYNWQHLYQEIPNGNRLEVAPAPEWRGENGETMGKTKITQSAIHLFATCDEREAAIDMLVYVAKCVFKYVSDYSLGTVDCEYEGLQGTTDYSKACMDALEKINASRTKKLKALGDNYDAEYVTKLNKYLDERGYTITPVNGDASSPMGYAEVTQMPPESSIPAIKGKYENSLKTFNSLYINK